jgi:hypothetical protein
VQAATLYLNDGYDDWLRFGFENLGVVDVSESAGSVRLVLMPPREREYLAPNWGNS